MDDQKLIDHLNLVIEANKTTNITRITSPDEAKILHIEDSLVGLEEMNRAPEGLYADLGSGAGYPGIPLALATGRKTVLVDSVKKKAAILDGFIKELGLSPSVSTYNGRIEELALERRGCFSVITARALSQLSSLMELASPLLSKGGHLICYKANVSDEEYEKARSMEDTFGFTLLSDRTCMLSDGVTTRRIIVFEKVGKPKVKLPRRNGLAQRNPL